MLTHPSPSTLVRRASVFLLILLWTYAALSKLSDPALFTYELQGHELIRPYARLFAWLIPVGELTTVALLFFKRTDLVGQYLSAGMLLLFTGYIIYMFIFYPYTPCSCGGIISRLSWKEHIAFNSFFLLVTVAGLFADEPPGYRYSA